jgi:ABC-type transporter MlaC component
MNSNTSVTATFALQSDPIIIARAGAGGSISPSGTVAVAYESSQSFTITPSNGYKIINVTVDGVSIGAVNNYLFGNVMANHTIKASFGPLSRNRWGSR